MELHHHSKRGGRREPLAVLLEQLLPRMVLVEPGKSPVPGSRAAPRAASFLCQHPLHSWAVTPFSPRLRQTDKDQMGSGVPRSSLSSARVTR